VFSRFPSSGLKWPLLGFAGRCRFKPEVRPGEAASPQLFYYGTLHSFSHSNSVPEMSQRLTIHRNWVKLAPPQPSRPPASFQKSSFAFSKPRLEVTTARLRRSLPLQARGVARGSRLAPIIFHYGTLHSFSHTNSVPENVATADDPSQLPETCSATAVAASSVVSEIRFRVFQAPT
jgi:hypothetical protein